MNAPRDDTPSPRPPRGPRPRGEAGRAGRVRHLPALLAALALLAVGLLSATAVSRLGSAQDDGPRITRVSVRAVELPFVDEDAGGPAGAAQVLDRELSIEGRGFFGTAFGPTVRFVTPDGARVEAAMVVLESGSRIRAWPPAGLRGALRLEVENPDRRTAQATIGL